MISRREQISTFAATAFGATTGLVVGVLLFGGCVGDDPTPSSIVVIVNDSGASNDTDVAPDPCADANIRCNPGETCAAGTCRCGSSATACARGLTCTPLGCDGWPEWPMPNPVSAGLPNSASYDSTTPNVVIDKITKLVWERDGSVEKLTRDEASARCATLTFATRNDWRLPTRIELVSLLDFMRPNPMIDVDVFPKTEVDDAFWSVSSQDTNGWIVSMNGSPSNVPPATVARSRCVASPPPPLGPLDRFTPDNGKGTVTDNKTKLVWQAQPPTLGINYSSAVAQCGAIAGTGWRLPSVKEMLTLIDETRSKPAIDASIFIGAIDGADSFASSTTFSQVFAVNLSFGGVVVLNNPGSTGSAGKANQARCVR